MSALKETQQNNWRGGRRAFETESILIESKPACDALLPHCVWFRSRRASAQTHPGPGQASPGAAEAPAERTATVSSARRVSEGGTGPCARGEDTLPAGPREARLPALFSPPPAATRPPVILLLSPRQTTAARTP